jgi:hypothetical protein
MAGFPNKLMPFQYVIFGLTEVLGFFYFSNHLTYLWAHVPERSYRRSVFWYAFLIRAIYVVFSYYFYLSMTGKPFEFDAGDSLFYNNMGNSISDNLISGNFHVFKDFELALSDQGTPLYYGIVYLLVFKSILFSRVVTAIFGAWSCLLVYDLARRNFGEATGRISGIMMMLAPQLIIYCGLTVKEIFLTFLCIAFVNAGDQALRRARVSISQVIILILTGGSLFLFRTVLGICAVFSIMLSLVMISGRVSGVARRLFILIVLFFGVIFLWNTGVREEVQFLIQNKSTNQSSQMEFYATREHGNKLATYGTKSIFFALIIPGPFPSLVDTGQDNLMVVSGGLYTRNIIAFFVFLALILLYKRKMLRRHIFLLSFTGAYLGVLALSAFANSERFHVPLIPFFLILAGYGVTRVNMKNRKHFTIYMIIMVIFIIGWNWFKLSGRGML